MGSTNPIYEEYFADPFVWIHDGTYYAVGTGAGEAIGQVGEMVFPVLSSRDLVTWQCLGRALVRPDRSLGTDFWAPEVAYAGGTFYLYYSVGHGSARHQLRVATSKLAEGPYVDIGSPVLDPSTCPFAIDPHPFQDEDGRWYLFYARDFLDTARPGTALAVAPLEDMTRMRAESRVVLRARYEWQRFLAGRAMYGGTFDWHTLEGPCVRKHGGRYYCFYSGGCWETDGYGVDYAVADHVLGPYADEDVDGCAERRPRVLRSVPNRVAGPGHNSIVVGPDGEREWIMYHAWNPERTRRTMRKDPLVWTPRGPRCLGPSG